MFVIGPLDVIYPRSDQKTAIQFLDYVLARLQFQVEKIQTDNGAEFQSSFHWHVVDQGIGHTYIRPATPRLNGKVERSHRIDAEEFYRLLDGVVIDDAGVFNDKLKQWQDYYNYHRPTAAWPARPPTRVFYRRPKPRPPRTNVSSTPGRLVPQVWLCVHAQADRRSHMCWGSPSGSSCWCLDVALGGARLRAWAVGGTSNTGGAQPGVTPSHRPDPAGTGEAVQPARRTRPTAGVRVRREAATRRAPSSSARTSEPDAIGASPVAHALRREEVRIPPDIGVDGCDVGQPVDGVRDEDRRDLDGDQGAQRRGGLS